MVKKAVREAVFDVPVWSPLEKVGLGELWIFLYKHIHTRRYLNIDRRGNAYQLEEDGYRPVELQIALNNVFS